MRHADAISRVKTDEMNADALIAGVLGNECTIFSYFHK